MTSEPAEPKLEFGPLAPTMFGLPPVLAWNDVSKGFRQFSTFPYYFFEYILILQWGLKPFRSLIRILYRNELTILFLKYVSIFGIGRFKKSVNSQIFVLIIYSVKKLTAKSVLTVLLGTNFSPIKTCGSEHRLPWTVIWKIKKYPWSNFKINLNHWSCKRHCLV